MATSILGVLGIVLTVLRSWPQFLRIVIKRQHLGVSGLTWAMALASHVAWFMYGTLEPIPLFVVVNLLAGAGCAAITTVLGSWTVVVGVIAGSLVASWLAYSISDGVLLALVTFLTFTVFAPQLIRVFKSSTAGVSLTTWAIAVFASSTWIAYAYAIGRPLVAFAHFFMLPSALLIFAKTLRESEVSAEAMAD